MNLGRASGPAVALFDDRGYEYAKNAYIPVDDDELDALAIESKHTIEIDSFVPREQIDERYLDSPYYITPNDRVGQEAFAVIREAMRGKGMVALGRVVLAKRGRVIMLEPWDNGLTATTLRYPYEIRDAKEYFDDIPNVKLEPEMQQHLALSLSALATLLRPRRSCFFLCNAAAERVHQVFVAQCKPREHTVYALVARI